MNKTKMKIVLAAIDLFNEEGLTNVRNQDIAKRAGISLSNFNYHFKTKRDLVHVVFGYMKEELEERVYGNKVLIMKGQGLEITRSYFEYERSFRFFYLDTFNIMQAYPELKKLIQAQLNEAVQIVKNLNYMAIGRGFLKPEPENMPGLYDNLARQTWINNHFWYAYIYVLGEEGDPIKKGMEAAFSILYPYLTERGLKVYRNFLDSL